MVQGETPPVLDEAIALRQTRSACDSEDDSSPAATFADTEELSEQPCPRDYYPRWKTHRSLAEESRHRPWTDEADTHPWTDEAAHPPWHMRDCRRRLTNGCGEHRPGRLPRGLWEAARFIRCGSPEWREAGDRPGRREADSRPGRTTVSCRCPGARSRLIDIKRVTGFIRCRVRIRLDAPKTSI
jgi:hypothetical protein